MNRVIDTEIGCRETRIRRGIQSEPGGQGGPLLTQLWKQSHAFLHHHRRLSSGTERKGRYGFINTQISITRRTLPPDFSLDKASVCCNYSLTGGTHSFRLVASRVLVVCFKYEPNNYSQIEKLCLLHPSEVVRTVGSLRR